ncbi:hypothetical protein A9Q90_04795 [Gammaproteobacteria bacterium 54_18_T64]|nr:hypothetical protein A9Q90_04795 [Gammaproteobacteria bacterium 54_18_T64]
MPGLGNNGAAKLYLAPHQEQRAMLYGHKKTRSPRAKRVLMNNSYTLNVDLDLSRITEPTACLRRGLFGE